MEQRPGGVDERCQEGMVEINTDDHAVARPAGILGDSGAIGNQGAFAILPLGQPAHGWVSILETGDGRDPRRIGQIAGGTDCGDEIAFVDKICPGGQGRVKKDEIGEAVGNIMDGLEASIVNFAVFDLGGNLGICIAAGAAAPIMITNRRIGFEAVSCIILTGGGVTNSLAGHILDREPGGKQERKIDDPENDHQENWKSQGKLNRSL